MFRQRSESIPPPDYTLIALVGLVVLIGLILLTSASGIVAFNKFGDTLFYVKRQMLFGIVPGLFLFCLGLYIPYTFWRRCAFPMFAVAVTLLVAVLIPGIGVQYEQGARSWFNIGGFSFQPAEFAKIAFLMYVSAWLGRDPSNVRTVRSGLIPFIVITGIIGGLVAMQPDIGTLGLIGIVAFAVYFVAGASWAHIASLGGVAAAAFGVMVVIAPYRLDRIVNFISPENDPTRKGYQIIQSFVAIGSGGWFGRGLGASVQKFQYLPEVMGDSIFSIFGEELGFVAASLFVLLFLVIAVRGLRIAKHAPDQFAKLFTVGVFTWILLQAFLNMGSMVGLVPLTGLPLSFVSYGGTALTFLLFALGIVANISRYQIRKDD